MRKIAAPDIKIGMIFDQPIFVEPYNKIVSSGKAVKQEDIELLKKWGIQFIQTDGELIGYKKGTQKTDEKEQDYESDLAVKEEILLFTTKLQYEDFRANKGSFNEFLQDTAILLEESFQSCVQRKPFETTLIEKAATQLVEQIVAHPMLMIAVQYMKLSSHFVITHSIRAACYGVLLARGLGYELNAMQQLVYAILLMDIGMFALPPALLQKQGSLTKEEVKLLKSHTILGYRLLSAHSRVKNSIAMVALQHHENFSPSGYPNGLQGNKIEYMARMARICDSYTAMTERRSYRKDQLPSLVIKKMISQSAKYFDPRLLKVFIDQISVYPIGSFIKLTQGSIVMVVATSPKALAKPIIRLMLDENGKDYQNLQFLSLAYREDISIDKPISSLDVPLVEKI